jgi:sulfoxide reductase heme-binding subunit YedZ
MGIIGSTNYFFGIAGFVILLALAMTSNRWAMRWLGKHWKSLHRWVYVAGALVTIHALWMLAFSKKAFLYGDGYLIELRIYIALYVVLMAVRVPFVRDLLKRVRIMVVKRVTGMSSKVKNEVVKAG